MEVPDTDGFARVPPAHPSILYFGRIDCSDPNAPAFAHAGISIRMRFEGEAVRLHLKDFGDGKAFNYYNVIIDGRAPERLEVSPYEEGYLLAEGLPAGPHTVEVFKRGESCPGDRPGAGKAAFLGFSIRGDARVLPLKPNPLRMEFVGDSITCGYGNEVSTMVPEKYPFTSENENAYVAWGAIAARELEAEYMSVAYSGRGMYRNWDSFPGETVPEMYLKIFPDEPDSPLWEPSRYVPDVTVVNLGTNDYSENAPDIDAVKRHYRIEAARFVETLRGYYPDTAIILAAGPMLSDSYPAGYDALSDVTAALTDIVLTRRHAGDDRVYFLSLSPHSAPWGEDWHPSAASHRRAADELIRFIEEKGIL